MLFLRAALSWSIGRAAACRTPLAQPFIRWFIRRYGVDMQEAHSPDPRAYASFTDFFCRPLKSGARPQPARPEALASPTDGSVSTRGDIIGGRVPSIKGRDYSIAELLGSAETARPFENGTYLSLYLAPNNYHRVHAPLEGRLRSSRRIAGDRHSVGDRALAAIPRLFVRNCRLAAVFEGPGGPWAIVFVGALNVSAIKVQWPETEKSLEDSAAGRDFARGSELGRFEIGSTVVLLFAAGAAELHDWVRPPAPVRVGDDLGTILSP